MLPSSTAQNIFIILVDASVVAAITAGILMHRPSHPLPWHLFAFGAVLILVGDIVWAIYDSFLQVAPYPSIVDVVYLASAPLFVAGLLLAGRGESVEMGPT